MKNLKKIREKSNLSQAQLAKMLNLTQQTICKYEKGTAEASFSTLTHMSNIFSIPISFLVNDNLDFNDLNKYNMSDSEQEKLLLAYFRNLTPDSKNNLLNLCKELSLRAISGKKR